MTSIADFYDDYVDRQVAAGINERHRSIVRFLIRFGLLPHHRVLELGAGVGTLTELLAEALAPNGALVAVDLSPRSIAVAKERLARFANVEFVAGDALEIELSGRYDVVVLPDVIEHIPLELHPELFKRVAGWLDDRGFAFVHYPNPHHLQWLAQHRPQILQVVDQPVHANVLVANTYAAGLYLDYYERYSIWVREGDYVAAVLRSSDGVRDFTELPEPRPSLARRALRRGRRLLDRSAPRSG